MAQPRRVHKAWLKVTAFVIGVAGPAFTLGAHPATDSLAQFSLDLLGWPVDGQPAITEPAARFLSALAGGFLVGWAVMLWRLSGRAYDAAPEPVRQSVLTGLLAWFLLDSAGSIASGHAANAVINIGVLLLGVGPMWRPAAEDRAGR
jgi:hypothetical protein